MFNSKFISNAEGIITADEVEELKVLMGKC